MNLRRFTATRAAVAYAAFGFVWVLVSDRLVAALFPGSVTAVQNVKGAVFVVASAGVIYLLVRASRRSLTESKRELERANRQSEVLQRVLRHNVRNTTNVVRGYAELLAEETDDPRREAFAGEIIEGADELVGISQQAKDLARLTGTGTGDPRTVDVAAIARERARDLRTEFPGATIEVDLPETLRVRGHPGLDEAIENLIENGIVHNDAATPRVRVTLEEVVPGSATVTVVDNGPGVPATELAVVEAGTETALVHSTGLGLWITRAAVDRSGGDLRIEEREGGTAVVLTLPTPQAERRPWPPDLEFPSPRPA